MTIQDALFRESIRKILDGVNIERTDRGSIIAESEKTYQYAKALAQIGDLLTGEKHNYL